MMFVGMAAVIAAVILTGAFVCYRMAFYAPRKMPLPEGEVDVPKGAVYEPFHAQFKQWAHEVRAMPFEDMRITSFDGLPLHAKYYEFSPDAPIELMFHGYRGNAERDLSGAVQRCFQLGHSACIVDQRGSGESGGRTITFGVKEHRDCLSWLAFMQTRFGETARIILCGISMGASTVMMAAGKPLPPTVVGVLADCGYHSQKEIIKKVIRQLKLPAELLYPLVKLGAWLYGGFDLEETTPIEALKTCCVPVLFFHGESDDFVPCEMSRLCFAACASEKKLVTVPSAGHGLSYPVAPEEYLTAVREFFGRELCLTMK